MVNLTHDKKLGESILEEKHICENKIPLYAYKNDRISTFAISLFIRYGILYESEGLNGFAHFFEHAVFRNINFLMNGELYKTLDKNALQFDGTTWDHYIEFRISGSHKHIDTAIDIFSMIFDPFAISSSELDIEKKRIKAEIHEDSSESLDAFADKVIWAGTPLTRKITGCCRDVDRYGIKLLKKMREQILSPENVLIYAGGNFSDQSIDKLKNKVSAYRLSSSDKRIFNAPTPTEFCKRDCKVVLKKAQSTSVIVSFDIPQGEFSIPEIYCTEDLLFSGESSPFHMELSDTHGLIYGFDDNCTSYKNISVASVKYEVRADNLMKSLSLVLRFFANAEKTVAERFYLVNSFYTDFLDQELDDARSIVSGIGYHSRVLEQDYSSLDERKSAFTSVKLEKVKELARRTFRTDNLVIAIGGNKKIDTKAVRTLAKEILNK